MPSMSNTPKRVSFGSHGSVVETLIIDDTMPAEEKTFYKETVLQQSLTETSKSQENGPGKGKSEVKVTFSESRTMESEQMNNSANHSPGGTSPGSTNTSPSSAQSPLPPIIKLHRTRSTDSHENPFTADGELSKKAEYIIRHSTISRSEIRISDPDLSRGEEQIADDLADGDTDNKPKEEIKENGKVEETVTPQNVQVAMAQPTSSKPEPNSTQAPEAAPGEDKGKDAPKDKKKCQCCVIM